MNFLKIVQSGHTVDEQKKRVKVSLFKRILAE